MELSTVDMFCGAGGSSTGLAKAGFVIEQAANHWERALESHAANHQNTMHFHVDLHKEHPRNFKPTTFAWFSPECRVHSPAGGRRRQKNQQLHLWEQPKKLRPEDERSRMTAWCVVRYLEYHRTPWACVENVIEFVSDWELFDVWVLALRKLGYQVQVCCFNAKYAHPEPSPSERDRVYIFLTQQGNHQPDVDFRLPGYCHHCQKETTFKQFWKRSLYKGDSEETFWVGRHKAQYVYCCDTCDREGEPCRTSARASIDWSLPTTRIRDREKPLSANTIKRIEKGLRRFAPKEFMMSNRSLNAPSLLDEPSKTLTANGGNWLVEPFLDVARRNAPCRRLEQPAATITAQGNHHAVVQPFISSYYGNGGEASVDSPFPTMRTVQGHALIEPDWTEIVHNCGYRMIEPHEARSLMGFPPDYIIHGNKKEKFKQIGGAVSPGFAQMAGSAIRDAIEKTRWI